MARCSLARTVHSPRRTRKAVRLFTKRGTRGATNSSVVAVPSDAPRTPGLAAFGRIESERGPLNGKSLSFTLFIAFSKRLSPKTMMNKVRAHWSVENNCHWPLDVVFDEDDATSRKNNGPYNLYFIRRMALEILQSPPDDRSVGGKMKLAAWS